MGNTECVAYKMFEYVYRKQRYGPKEYLRVLLLWHIMNIIASNFSINRASMNEFILKMAH